MSSISSIDTSIYSSLIEGLASGASKGSSSSIASSNSSSSASSAPIDLSNYYANVTSQDLLTEVGENVAEAAANLDNAMVSALENGFSVQDAVNINLAQQAYKANCTVLKTTFELAV